MKDPWEQAVRRFLTETGGDLSSLLWPDARVRCPDGQWSRASRLRKHLRRLRGARVEVLRLHPRDLRSEVLVEWQGHEGWFWPTQASMRVRASLDWQGRADQLGVVAIRLREVVRTAGARTRRLGTSARTPWGWSRDAYLRNREFEGWWDRLRDQGYEVRWGTLDTPIQVEGRLPAGPEFYFRCRGEECSLEVYPTGAPLLGPDPPPLWSGEESRPEWGPFHAGYLACSEAERVFQDLVRRHDEASRTLRRDLARALHTMASAEWTGPHAPQVLALNLLDLGRRGSAYLGDAETGPLDGVLALLENPERYPCDAWRGLKGLQELRSACTAALEVLCWPVEDLNPLTVPQDWSYVKDLELVQWALAGGAVWKVVVERLSPWRADPAAVREVAMALEEGRCPGWLGARLLGALRDEASGAPLLQLLEQDVPEAGPALASALGRGAELVLVEALERARSPRMRRAIAEGLARVGAIPAVVQSRAFSTRVAWAAAAAGPDPVALQGMMESSDPRVRHFALQILAEWAQLSRDVKPEAWKHLELFSAFFEPRRQQVEALVKQTRPSRLLRRRLGV